MSRIHQAYNPYFIVRHRRERPAQDNSPPAALPEKYDPLISLITSTINQSMGLPPDHSARPTAINVLRQLIAHGAVE